ncbi:DUF371 domain-containing protein [Candidatus Woesearchaeota archaeon]|nr:DUF371 domain-containing protein [Candidatus Woesearchaeota archaeon]
MIYKFNAYGHQNILGNHKTTLEFTRDKEVSLKGDCIIGVNADFDLDKLKEFIKKSNNKKVTIAILPFQKNKKIKETISAEINPDFNNGRELVIRKTGFISERTFAINSNKAAFELKRDIIGFLKEKKSRIRIVMRNN